MENTKKGQMNYTVDIVFCIDATKSMEPVINLVKENATNFYGSLKESMDEKGKHMNDDVRIKLVVFRDYLADRENAMLMTNFFALPQDSEEFSRTVNGIEASGGGDIPEDGLEALAYAIKSDWRQEGTKRRQIIVVWSDAGTHPLGFGKESVYYPTGMAKNFEELTDWWMDPQTGFMHSTAKRLILYVPEPTEEEKRNSGGNGWSDVVRNWTNVIYYPSQAGRGLDHLSYKEIISAIVQSV